VRRSRRLLVTSSDGINQHCASSSLTLTHTQGTWRRGRLPSSMRRCAARAPSRSKGCAVECAASSQLLGERSRSLKLPGRTQLLRHTTSRSCSAAFRLPVVDGNWCVARRKCASCAIMFWPPQRRGRDDHRSGSAPRAPEPRSLPRCNNARRSPPRTLQRSSAAASLPRLGS